MEPTHLQRGPLESASPSPAKRLRGAVGATMVSILLGVLIASLIAIALVVLAVIAITTLG